MNHYDYTFHKRSQYNISTIALRHSVSGSESEAVDSYQQQERDALNATGSVIGPLCIIASPPNHRAVIAL
ncbi:hypothetical protein NUKP42_34770 [Klebsiella variicola]|nr:hypothetical protein NUKP42_34770 [Klebsiella variicola]